MTLIEAPCVGTFPPPFPHDQQPQEQYPELTSLDVEPVREHVGIILPGLICYPDQITDKRAIKLNHQFMVPSNEEVEGFSYGQQQFNWDGFFHARLMMLKDREYGFPKNSELFRTILGTLENSGEMFDEYDIIPNSSLKFRTGHSQPPLHTSYVFEVYDTYKDVHPETINLPWLSAKIAKFKDEYNTVWMGTSGNNIRLVHKGLSRYFDPDLTDDHVQAESGHDYSPRFNGRSPDYLPVDLNAMLYKYEMDFAREAELRSDHLEMNYWLDTAEARRVTMNELMYDPVKGVFHDYNYKIAVEMAEKKHSDSAIKQAAWGKVDSLAGYATMWAGMVEPHSEQAEQMVHALKLFEHIGGIAVTEKYKKPYWERRKLQWGYPNAFSPTTIMTTDGLEIAGYPGHARRIAMKSLNTKARWYGANGNILEATNAVRPTKMPKDGMYPRQKGFGFSDAEVEYYSAKYVDGQKLPTLNRMRPPKRQHIAAASMRGAVLLDMPLN